MKAELGIGAVIFVLSLVLMAVVTIDQGDRAVVTTFGEVSGEMEPGVNLRIPIVQGVHKYTVREQVAAFGDQKTATSSLDFNQMDAKTDGGADMQTDIAIGFTLDTDTVRNMYTEVGKEKDYHEKIVENQIDSTVRDVASNYTIDELHRSKGRNSFQKQIKSQLQTEFEPYGLTVTRVNLENINFADSIEDAINAAEAKQYEIKKQQREVDVEEARADARRAEAKGLRDSERIATEAFESEAAYLQYLFITEALANEKATTPMYVPMNSQGGLEMFKDIDNINGSVAR